MIPLPETDAVTVSPRPWHTRWLRRLFVGLAILLLAVGAGRAGQVWLESQQSGPRVPYLQNVTPDAITVRWQSAAEVVAKSALVNGRRP